jgi:hypothetical protein
VPVASRGIVVFGDVVDSRRGAARSTEFLRALRDELEDAYPAKQRLARFAFTQGDELQLLLAPGSDPFLAALRAGLREDSLPMRWAMVAGRIDVGSGPTIERTGEAFLAARDRIERAKVRRERLVAHTGDPGCDALLADLAPSLPALLGDLTDRQRALARLVLVDGLRRADVAERLSVSRATVSVMAERAHVREVGGLVAGLASVFRDGEAVANGDAAAVPGTVTAGAGAR